MNKGRASQEVEKAYFGKSWLESNAALNQCRVAFECFGGDSNI